MGLIILKLAANVTIMVAPNQHCVTNGRDLNQAYKEYKEVEKECEIRVLQNWRIYTEQQRRELREKELFWASLPYHLHRVLVDHQLAHQRVLQAAFWLRNELLITDERAMHGRLGFEQ
jgi:hypothetical protein